VRGGEWTGRAENVFSNLAGHFCRRELVDSLKICIEKETLADEKLAGGILLFFSR
jgi:hypothetical protein